LGHFYREPNVVSEGGLQAFGKNTFQRNASRNAMPHPQTEPRDPASPAAAPSTKRRLASQHVREARVRLTSQRHPPGV
jgi:hypothetical protein